MSSWQNQYRCLLLRLLLMNLHARDGIMGGSTQSRLSSPATPPSIKVNKQRYIDCLEHSPHAQSVMHCARVLYAAAKGTFGGDPLPYENTGPRTATAQLASRALPLRHPAASEPAVAWRPATLKGTVFG